MLGINFVPVPGKKGWTLNICLTENGRILVEEKQHQDICETDGFLLQPLHIFSSFLELYDTVFHMPKEGQTTSRLVLTSAFPSSIVQFINC